VRFAGHHLKVWHYFNHVLASPGHTARVRFWPESLLDDTNPWMSVPELVLDRDAPVDPDLWFLSGMDWTSMPAEHREDSPVPVINLVQHPTNFDPGDPRYALLSNRAIRICISPEVAEGIEATGLVRGPVFVIPDAIDLDEVRAVGGSPERDIDVLVAAIKNPAMGRAVAARLARPGRHVHLIDERLTHRSEFLELLARARVTVFLPWHQEGFYLPAIEAMALESFVVCPDVLGNRSFCRHEQNCFRPAYEEDALVAAAERAIAELPDLGALLEEGRRTAAAHDLGREREAFLPVLARAHELWAS
jgi:glycosyltransferase involved in cell wall biosynthesis